MKRIIAACFAGLLIFAATASAATPTQRITTLEKKLKTLTNVLDATLAIEFCLIGVTADALQGTWTTIDQASGTSVFGPQQTISDANACSALQIARQGIRVPPTTSIFSALVALVTSRNATLRLG